MNRISMDIAKGGTGPTTMTTHSVLAGEGTSMVMCPASAPVKEPLSFFAVVSGVLIGVAIRDALKLIIREFLTHGG